MNEIYNIVKQIEMSSIRLINNVQFYDQESKLIAAGVEGAFVFDFQYQGKYDPAISAQIDQEGKSIDIELRNKVILYCSICLYRYH